MARELGPQGIHVAHSIIDGAIDTEFIRTNFPQAYAKKDEDGILNPDHIADQYWMLHTAAARCLDARTRSSPLVRNLVRPRHDQVEFLFDFGSPNAYLAHKVIPGIEKRTGAKFDYVPVLLGGIFKLTNNKPPMVAFKDVKGKMEYEMLETQRFIQRHGLTKFKFNPHFPVNTLLVMRGAVAAEMRRPCRSTSTP